MSTPFTNRIRWLRAVGVAVAWIVVGAAMARAQVGPLQLDQSAMLFATNYERGANWQSIRGVPISSASGNGSDGRYNFNNGPSTLPNTTNQFRSFVSFGAVPVQGATNLNTNQSFAANAQNLKWPAATTDGSPSSPIAVVLRGSVVGAPYFGQQVSFRFGDVIPPPSTDENGQPLPPGANLSYWFPIPYSTNNFANAPYYWSPHAGAVFAIQAGGVDIVWKKVNPYTTQPADYTAHPENYYTNATYFYPLYKQHYIVSGAPVKTPEKMYWTEGSFQDFGHPVSVPPARVSAVNIIYNSSFPERVGAPYDSPESLINTNALLEFRTLWYDNTRKQILAYNVEGRVFAEFLGELNPDGTTRRFLGFEIIDVFKQAAPSDIRVELGERINAYQDARDDSNLSPAPILQTTGQSYYYQQVTQGSDNLTLYATRETANLNDVQIHWLISGVAGLQWPFLFDRYTQVWPTDPARYTHYLRPRVATESQAMETAVQLPPENAPVINWQDPLDVPRAKLTTTFKFYTFLAPARPAHRTLLRYTSGDRVAFERVFSWLDTGVKTNSVFDGSVAATLDGWDSTNKVFNFPVSFVAPYVFNASANVGDRIEPPAELLANGNDWAGHLRVDQGDSYNPKAYADPYTAGFDAAGKGSIIPVNAIPGKNNLEVWWFRRSQTDLLHGFLQAYWPVAIGRYSLEWPTGASEIILASNAGSGGLSSLQAKGTIYYQNDSKKAGYNPNEEHALMIGGQAYALRDDLNNTNAAGYSSAPFVLIDYTGPDNRPAMAAFHVRREKPEAGILFDYVVDAGSRVQAPMPLPLLEAPVEDGVNFNVENLGTTDLPPDWNIAHHDGVEAYDQFTFCDRKNGFWVYRGLNAGLPAFNAGTYSSGTGFFGNPPAATAVANQPFAYYLHASRRAASLTLSSAPALPPGLAAEITESGLAIAGIPTTISSNTYALTISDTADGSQITRNLSLKVIASGAIVAQQPLTITSTNSYSGSMVTYTTRPPYLASEPTPANSFTMSFYYKTQAGFAWPGMDNPPEVGSIVPYLLPFDEAGEFLGDPSNKNTPSLGIVYRPTWPALVNGQPIPTLQAGETLTVSAHGMAGVRGQSSAQILYQQSIAKRLRGPLQSAALFDPTVRKTSGLAAHNLLMTLPASIVTDTYQGRIYFPNLPPHLVNRVYVDPNSASLVLEGKFVDNVTSHYLLLNVLTPSDLASLEGLCPADAPESNDWIALVDDLSAPLYTFGFDAPGGPYHALDNLTQTIGATNLVEITNSDQPVDSYAIAANGPGFGYITYVVGNGLSPSHAGEPVSMYVVRVAPPLTVGQLVALNAPNPLSEQTTLVHTVDLAGQIDDYEYDWRISPPVDGLPPTTSPLTWTPLLDSLGARNYILGGSGIQTLGDNYVALRYRSTHPEANPAVTNWSDWTPPVLVEGWIKRVLAGINPFNQRTSDLFNNPVNTTATIISQAGHRWEGDVALNAQNINNFGLIEIYETLLHRGELLSVNAGINYGPANDALLLAAGYLNDLYMMVGNDAWADAANPTIGIGTADKNYGNIATALFAFKGQESSLLEEELALLRGRDDTLAPGVGLAPVYNRLYWNYTRGIDAGEVIYALNYNILDQNTDGVVNAQDASILYPQGHGDAYGHYLTALKNYYGLLMNPNFDWVPRIEAVTILGAAVSVDYQDERKFASAAASLARSGRQIFDLSWRQNYKPGEGLGWKSFGATRVNQNHTYKSGGQTKYVTRSWGMDHWASRVGQGSFLNWVVGNAILPPVDPDPNHEGIQKVDRTTVPELKELPQTAAELQADMDNANLGITPLNVSQRSVPFDINPQKVTGSNPQTHFEQVYERSVAALNNAVVAFNDAQNVTQQMRSEEDSLANLKAGMVAQELAYNNQLIELYGTPYADDMGPGKTWPQDYTGPDLIHFTYVDNPDTNYFNYILADPTQTQTFAIDAQLLPTDWLTNIYSNFDFIVAQNSPDYAEGPHYINFTVGPNGFFDKPLNWTGKRQSPGEIQQAISALIAARDKLRQELYLANFDKYLLDKAVNVFKAQRASAAATFALENQNRDNEIAIEKLQTAFDILDKDLDTTMQVGDFVKDSLLQDLPESSIFGTAFGGDTMFPVRIGVLAAYAIAKLSILTADTVAFNQTANQILETQKTISDIEKQIATNQFNVEIQNSVLELADKLGDLQNHTANINVMLRGLDDAQRAYDAVVAKGNRIQQERLTYRQHAAALVQGYRTRDAAFRIFQNEKLERYKTLFDLAAQYAFLAANAYDYETGLLNTSKGQSFVNRIVAARSLGVVAAGKPQYAGSDTGDPGLSSALAEMKADWDVLKGRLGFNNPDGYGTIVSLRAENYRVLSGAPGDDNWRDVLQNGRTPNLLADADVRRYCQQIDDGSGTAVPGIILTFRTVIADGQNLFGKPLAPGDHNFSPSSFATRIFSVGVDFDGYIGMDNPAANGGAVGGTGGSSPTDPTLDPNGLAATPYVYLIPVGADFMRSPPLGDASAVRTWNVDDLAIPLPFDISGADLASTPFYTSLNSLSEPLFNIRKHQAFRPVSTTSVFNTSIYGANGQLQPSQYTNKRLIGRSIWNSQWKLVIPGKTLLADPNQGLDRFIQSVKDAKLYFITYSYAGN